ncbi:hypothetical protein HPB47_014002 [Ixodes persulcatus]|uniref:Uncharacterized protein n=1 Tax=Ixodes persulcatus TaxID=34615 RepID=A0AC60R0N1_IXOPE|nr:hypothetical protein HPB47_014002 [Ixodes persulcatus]
MGCGRSEKTPTVDARLLHLWEARRGLTKRWKRQRHNKIRTKIQELTKVAEDHAVDLARNNWYGICDSIHGSLCTARSWHLLRALIDPTKTKSVTDSRIAELVYELPSDTERIMDQLARNYLCLERAEETLEYLGRENSELDRPVSVAEFEYELGAMKRGTAPGPDTITAKLLYNLEEGELRKLVNHFNEHYRARGALGAVPGVEHAIYADDITLRCREGNDTEIEERLQAAAKIVEDYAEERGLKCAPEKFELLVLRNPYESVSEQIEVWVSGKRVSKPTEIRILGQLIRQGRGNKSTIDKLDTMTTQRTATDKLLKLGVHNTIDELHEAHLVAQLKRLASTKNGAWLMDKLGMALSAEIRKKIVASRIPRNMQPGKDDGRRKARSEALSKAWDHKEGTLYVDCGGPVNRVATIAVANAQGRELRLASVRVESAGQAEEAAIALAVVCNPRATVISDSQKACGNFARGMVCAVADRILSKMEVQGVHLIWSPGHTGNTGNEAANAAARGCILRDSSQSGGQVEADLSFNEALKTKKLDRRVFPSPCGELGKEEWTWRRLQTGTLVTPAKLHQWYPDRYTTGACPFCGDPWADVHHVTWKCKKIPGLAPLVEPSTQEWEAGLQSDVIDVQKLLVTRALHAQAAIGALE